MYNLKIDNLKNRLYIYIKDKLSDSEIEEYTKDIIKLIDKLEYGFTVIADLKDADILVLKDYYCFNAVREYGQKKGVKDTVVILDDIKINMLENEMSIKNRNIARSFEEAENYLVNT